MSNQQKLRYRYYFTVEGKTERLYFEWLKRMLKNASNGSLDICVYEKTPLKFARENTTSPFDKTEVTHVVDFEGINNSGGFFRSLDAMKKANNKVIKYSLGYTNLAFELWMILHKSNCPHLNRNDDYLKLINKSFGTDFISLSEYKNEDSFKKNILGQLTLEDVYSAIARAKEIDKNCVLNECVSGKSKGYKYYIDNPSLSIHESIEKILCSCGLLNT